MAWHLETRVRCECGFSALHVIEQNIPLSENFEYTCHCCVCGKEITYAYEFSADFSHVENHCIPAHHHYIPIHFVYNEMKFDIERYLLCCICGEEILLKQRRVK